MNGSQDFPPDPNPHPRSGVQGAPSESLPAEPGVAELPENIAAMLAAMAPPVTGIAFWLLDKNRRLVRFYSLQTILLGVVGVAAWLAVGILGIVHRSVDELFLVGPFLGLVHGLMLLAVGAAYIAAIAIQLLKAWRHEEWELPWIGRHATKMLANRAAVA